jgi:uncharacterized membrane protein YkvA (DUF1232 family)
MKEIYNDNDNYNDNEIIEYQQEYTRPLIKTIGYVLLLIICIIYIINPGGGIMELIPDFLPVVGNLDEAGAASAMVLIIQKLKAGTY